jgi:chaperonin GroEL
LVIVADDFKQDFIEAALAVRDQMTVLPIKAPGFGELRPQLLTDIAKLCNTRVFGKGFPEKLSEVKLEDLGKVGKVVATNDETILTGTVDVADHIKDLEAKLKTLKSDLRQAKAREANRSNTLKSR